MSKNIMLYKKDSDIPKYRDMECYFSAPLVGIFSEVMKYYYLIKFYDNTYWVMMHDESQMSCMNGGMINENDKYSKYQADEYNLDSLEELYEFLSARGFDEYAILDIKKLVRKLVRFNKKQHKIDQKIDHYIVMEDVYHIDIYDAFFSKSEIDKWSPYISKGTKVTLENNCYLTSDGNSVPIEHCRVYKI